MDNGTYVNIKDEQHMCIKSRRYIIKQDKNMRPILNILKREIKNK